MNSVRLGDIIHPLTTGSEEDFEPTRPPSVGQDIPGRIFRCDPGPHGVYDCGYDDDGWGWFVQKHPGAKSQPTKKREAEL